MSNPGFMERLVDRLGTSPLFDWIAHNLLVPYWARRLNVRPAPGGPPPNVQTGDNVARMMNLIMPLKDKTALGRAKAALALSLNVEGIMAGLDNVGNVHDARFIIVGDHLCMLSVYDGDFSNYIRDFIAQIGPVFNALVELVEGGEAVIPCEQKVEAFIDWVHAHDALQLPDLAADILGLNGGGGAHADLRLIPRDLILQLHANPHVSLGTGYRANAGFSVAQIRRKMETGW